MNAQLMEKLSVSPAEYRAAAALFPTGVTVVTRLSRHGKPYGMTVSSFTSVSLTPPLILVCIDKRAGFGADLVSDPSARPAFAVNVLSEQQQHLAVRFSTGTEQERFAGVGWQPGFEQVPLLDGVVASFSCLTEDVVNAGDHFVLIGRVEEIHRHDGRPLVWCHSAYHCLPQPPATSR